MVDTEDERTDEESITLFQEWKRFEAAVVPQQAGVQQREVCRRCFYAGARALYELMMHYADSPTRTYNQVRRLHHELDAFDTDIRHGI